MNPTIAHLFLAAGSSSRMGQAKQLLPWKGHTLIEHQLQCLLQTKQEVMVVLGGHVQKILPVIEPLPITIFINPAWEGGMGSSIAFGMKQVLKQGRDLDGILISLVDQPLVTATHLKRIIASFQAHQKQIVVSQASSGFQGPPVLFDQCYFEELSQLRGDGGAKKVIQKHHALIKNIECGEMLADMDTPEAYEDLWKRFGR